MAHREYHEKDWRAVPSSPWNDEDARRIGPVLERLGSLTAQTIVDEAADKQSPIHRDFQWDDQIAANEHRKERARLMARSIEVVVESHDGRQVQVRNWFAIPVKREEGAEKQEAPDDEPIQSGKPTPRQYVSFVDVNNSEEMADVVKADLLAALIGIKARYKKYLEVFANLEEFRPVFRAIDRLDDAA